MANHDLAHTTDPYTSTRTCSQGDHTDCSGQVLMSVKDPADPVRYMQCTCSCHTDGSDELLEAAEAVTQAIQCIAVDPDGLSGRIALAGQWWEKLDALRAAVAEARKKAVQA